MSNVNPNQEVDFDDLKEEAEIIQERRLIDIGKKVRRKLLEYDRKLYHISNFIIAYPKKDKFTFSCL